MIESLSAGGIVFKQTKSGAKWLICQNSAFKCWIFPKGQVGDKNIDESLIDAAVREVMEEGGVKARVVGVITPPIEYFFTSDGTRIHKTVHYFLMEYESGDPKLHDKEISEAKFVDFEVAMKTLTFDNDKMVFGSALKQLNQSKK